MSASATLTAGLAVISCCGLERSALLHAVSSTVQQATNRKTRLMDFMGFFRGTQGRKPLLSAAFLGMNEDTGAKRFRSYGAGRSAAMDFEDHLGAAVARRAEKRTPR